MHSNSEDSTLEMRVNYCLVFWGHKAPEIKLNVCKASNSLSKRVKLLTFCTTKTSIKAKRVEQTALEYENSR